MHGIIVAITGLAIVIVIAALGVRLDTMTDVIAGVCLGAAS